MNQIVNYDNNGNERSRKELFYNSNNQIIFIETFFEGQLLSAEGNYIYGNDGNITEIEGGNNSFIFDINPSPYQNLSIQIKLFMIYIQENLSICSQKTTYCYVK